MIKWNLGCSNQPLFKGASMFRFDQLIRRDMIIRDVKQRHPETIPVFEEFRYRP